MHQGARPVSCALPTAFRQVGGPLQCSARALNYLTSIWLLGARGLASAAQLTRIGRAGLAIRCRWDCAANCLEEGCWRLALIFLISQITKKFSCGLARATLPLAR